MTRSIWKGPYVDNNLWKIIRKTKNSKELKIWSRRSFIFPQMVGQTCQINGGNKWVNFKINEDKVGHLFGEFVYSKKIAQFKRKKK